MGFSRGPDIGGLLTIAVIVGVIGFAIAAYEGPLWQKLLIAPGVVLAYVAAGLAVSLLFAGIFWIYFFGAKLRKKSKLNRLLQLEREGDLVQATALAQSICESFDFAYSDLFRDTPALCLQFADAARRDGPLRPYYLRTLMDNAPWSSEVESTLIDGREAVAPRDRWRWLYWFRTKLPDNDPAAADRLAGALEYSLASGNDYDRRRSWADCLQRVRDSEPWHRLAARYHDDLAALDAESGTRLTPRERQGLDLLLGKARPAGVTGL